MDDRDSVIKDARRSRSSSNASSRGSDDWILLSSSGTEMESCSSQTVPEPPAAPELPPANKDHEIESQRERKESTSSRETGDSYDVVSPSFSPSGAEEEDRLSEGSVQEESCLDTSSSTLLDEGKSSTESNGEEGNKGTPSSDEMSILDESELLEDIRQHRKSIDPEKVARLLDALAKSAQTKEPETEQKDVADAPAPSYNDGGDLPANFVQMYSDRIQNYIHTANSRLNWKLSLLLIIATATVLGLGLGHFIGSTHAWLRRHRVGRQQVETLKAMQDHVVSCTEKLSECKVEVVGLQRQLTGCRQMETHCSAHDKPICDNVLSNSMLECQKKLEICEQKLETAESEVTRKATVNNWALNRMRELQKNLTIHNEKVGRYMVARIAQRRAERRATLMLKRIRRNDAKVRNLEGTIQELRSEKEELTGGIWRLSRSNLDLRAKATQERASLMEQVNSLTQTLEDMEESCHPSLREHGQSLSWEGVAEFFDNLKNSGNVTETVKAYLAIVGNLDLTEYVSQLTNASDRYAGEQLKQFGEILRNLQELTAWKLKELRKLADNPEFHRYKEGAEALKEKVETALSQVWDKTKIVANTVRRQHGHKVQDIVEEFSKHINDVVEDISPTVKESWTALSDRVQDIFSSLAAQDSSPRFDEEETPTEEEEVTEEDILLGESAEEEKRTSEIPLPPEVPVPVLKDVTPEEAVAQMYEFRYALKRSTLEAEIGEEMGDRYSDHLKYLGKRQGLGKSSFSWWRCQKEWWTSAESPGSAQCLGDIWKWQRNYQVFPSSFLDRNELVKDCVNSWLVKPAEVLVSSDDEHSSNNQCAEDEEEERQGDTSWFFERSSARDEMRSAETRSDWVFERSRSRDRQRKEQEEGYKKTEWVFQRGRERAKRRDLEDLHEHRHGRERWTWKSGPDIRGWHHHHKGKKRNERRGTFRRASTMFHW